MISDPYFYLAAIPAVILVGLAKGGFAGIGMLGMPILVMASSPLLAAAVLLPVLIVQDFFSVYAYRKTWDAENLKILMPSAVVGIFAGYLLASVVSSEAVGLAIGLISMIFGMQRLFLADSAPPDGERKLNRPFGWLCGFGCGFTSMISHAGGPPFQIFVMPQQLPREVFAGTGTMLFTLINLVKLPPYMALGQLTRESLLTSAVLFPLAVASTASGVWLVRRVSTERFYLIVNVLLVVLGARLTYVGVKTIFL